MDTPDTLAPTDLGIPRRRGDPSVIPPPDPGSGLPGTPQPSPCIRRLGPGDLAPALALNNRSQPEVGGVSIAGLADLVRQAVVADGAFDDLGLCGLCVTLGPDARYGSLNYAWLCRRLRRFVYVDRIAVHPRAQGRGIGRAFYERVFAAAGAAPVVCEVNLMPPNPASRAFHRRMGFRPIGRAWNPEHGKLVVFLRRDAR
jgi:predicted GNAT superfamily acetyltransferase